MPCRILLGMLLPLLAHAPGTAQEKTIPITGAADGDLAPLDDVMRALLADNQVPGAALAVARNGRLVYARGFGYADRQLGLPVQPGMRFRIASISKPITAVLILALIERGLFRLDDNPFALLRIAIPEDADPRLRRITIRHLLEHSAGFDRTVSFDPMFRPLVIAKQQKTEPPAKPRDIIAYMIGQKLDFDPGQRYAYSNFGYCLLGRVIEKVTGQGYEAAVQKHLFEPIGVKHSQLGRTLTTAENEVRYYDFKERTAEAVMGPNLGKPVPLPYGAWNLEAMDSHGGWISTAPDLVRFASAFDPPDRCKFLKPASIQTMFARPDYHAAPAEAGNASNVFYGCGWNVRDLGARRTESWHTGSLDGTESLLVRRSDGFAWAVLFNTNNRLSKRIDPLLREAVGKIKRWPASDLFEKGF